jgi:uncharacterized protein (DUF2235 family)
MSKNIVICCDGTGNEIGETISNVLKLYRILTKTKQQRVYYNPGVGTIGLQNAWQRVKQQAIGVFGLATGHGLDNDVLSAYRFLCETYEEGDQIWLFGFSRGAYAVRVLAAFLHVIGLLRRDQLNIAGYAFAAYKKASAERAPAEDGSIEEDAGSHSSGLAGAWHFGRVAGGRAVRIAFIGVWDTVASVIVPRDDTLLPDLQTLRYTRTNSSVKTFRQAIAIDERRRMFRINRWTDPQTYRPNPFEPTSAIPQDIRQVWFAGVHADIGGGYPEAESGLSKFPLLWMIEEAAAQGLLVNRAMINHLVLGRRRLGSRHSYVPPDAKARPHNSMNAAWRVLEWLPKSAKWQDWPDRRVIFGHYLPQAEPRLIPQGALIHRSVLDHMKSDCRYDPSNLPNIFDVEEGPDISSGAHGRTGTEHGADEEEL